VRVAVEVEGKGNFRRGQRRTDGVEMVRQARAPVAATNRCGIAPFADDCARSYLSRSGFDTAFANPCCADRSARWRLARRKISRPLAAAFGPAEIDKAILDALLRSVGVNFFDGMSQNIAGIDARLSPDLRDEDLAQFLAGRQRLARVAIRHTVGLDDKVEGTGGVADTGENAGARYFKLKFKRRSGTRYGALDPDRQRARHAAIRPQRHAGCQRAICRPGRLKRARRSSRP